MMYHNDPFHPLFAVLIVILLIAIIIRVIRGPRMGGRGYWRGGWGMGGPGAFGPRGHENALSILNERYAKGEINKEEYEAKKKDLHS